MMEKKEKNWEKIEKFSVINLILIKFEFGKFYSISLIN